jgi:hypothetical protein
MQNVWPAPRTLRLPGLGTEERRAKISGPLPERHWCPVSRNLEQDHFGLNHFASTATWRPKRESCSIHGLESKIHVP